jgi:XTP/dITP diphosphohydrolase
MSELLRLAEVMNKLRSPGGCPWDAEQTHESLIKYLLEESYEFIDAVESDDRAGLQEELGDLLLQVYFHSRIAQDHPDQPFTIEDVARGIADKLISRHPHVFADMQVSGVDEVISNWEEIKAAEKGRTSAIDGVALSQPSLALILKLLHRAEKFGVELDLPNSTVSDADSAADQIVAIAAWASANEIDLEALLRQRARALMAQIQSVESR